MASYNQLGYPEIPRSITSPNYNRSDVLDKDYPMSFITFIKTINVTYEPESLQNYYNAYLKNWNMVSGSSSTTNENLIVERYRDFLKDVSLNYTTLEEKKFLSSLDFNDPFDMDIAIPFYSKKLKEIALYYREKREDVKFEPYRKKIKGTNLSLNKAIVDIALDHLESNLDSAIYLDLGDIKRNLEIEIEELYDGYPKYFNQTPDIKIYDNKDLDYGYDIFLKSNTELLSSVFSTFSNELKVSKELDNLLDNKRKLTENSVATDFYYLSTGNTVYDFISGRLFEAKKDSENILNRNYPTTASTERYNLQTPRERGFFKPSKASIVLVDGKNDNFYFNFELLKPNTIYYFPDPKITGENGNILTFNVNDGFLKKNFTSGNASNYPNSTPLDNKYYGYISNIDHNQNKYLDTIFDSGYVSDAKQDLHNNYFGLFKITNSYNKNISNEDPGVVKSILLNGHTFYDTLYTEGYSFNFETYDSTTYSETLRSGLSSNTGNFNNTDSRYTLFFRNFSPYQELVESQENIATYKIYDGAFLLKNNNSKYDDPISSDLYVFPGSDQYYYQTLLESGVNNSITLQRGLLDSSYPSLTANMTQSVRISGSNDVFELDGGNFLDDFAIDYSLDSNGYELLDKSPEFSTSFIELSSNFEYLNSKIDLLGKIFVKNSFSKEVKPLLEAIPYLSSKHPQSVMNELSGRIHSFEISRDTLFIQTSSNLVIEKIRFDGLNFINPNSTNTRLSFNSNKFNKISNRFKVKDDVYYCVLETLNQSITSNNFILYPNIYKFNLKTFKNEKIFPSNISDVTTNFIISGGDVRYEYVDSVVLTHNSRNNIYNISFLLKDQNSFPNLRTLDFRYDSDVEFIDKSSYKAIETNYTTIFDSDFTENIQIFLSSGDIRTVSEELIL
jgi:hypothetical protein